MFKLIVNGKNGKEESDNFSTHQEALDHFNAHLNHWGPNAQFSIEDNTAKDEAERTKRETKKADRDSRVDQFKKIDWSTIDTIAELKAIVRSLVREAIKDEE